MNWHKISLVLLTLFTLGTLAACSANPSHSSSAKEIARQKGSSSQAPTFFFHGYGSSINAERHMAQAARSQGVTHTILTAIVNKKGQVKVHGDWSRHAKNPIILVGFRDNRNGNYWRDGYYARQAVSAVEKRHRFKQMKVVGHSMGNMAIMYLIMRYGHKIPKITRQVDLAGHFNGIRGIDPDADSQLNRQGKPAVMNRFYRQLLQLRKVYPHASVMNVYGDLKDGSHSDGDVPVNSARSLRYLVSGRASHYEEHGLSGQQAQHSNLHRNRDVDRLLIRFLWGK